MNQLPSELTYPFPKTLLKMNPSLPKVGSGLGTNHQIHRGYILSWTWPFGTKIHPTNRVFKMAPNQAISHNLWEKWKLRCSPLDIHHLPNLLFFGSMMVIFQRVFFLGKRHHVSGILVSCSEQLYESDEPKTSRSWKLQDINKIIMLKMLKMSLFVA